MNRTKRVRKTPSVKNPRNSKTTASIVALTTVQAKAPAIQVPLGGFRTISVKEKIIHAEITANPNFTAREYGDRLGMIAPRVNDFLLFTREGRALAEQGLIALPCRNRPRWASYVTNQGALVRRQRESQFVTLKLSGSRTIKGDNRFSLEQISAIVRQLDTTTSPRALRNMHQEICAVLVATGKARAKEQAELISLRR